MIQGACRRITSLANWADAMSSNQPVLSRTNCATMRLSSPKLVLMMSPDSEALALPSTSYAGRGLLKCCGSIIWNWPLPCEARTGCGWWQHGDVHQNHSTPRMAIAVGLKAWLLPFRRPLWLLRMFSNPCLANICETTWLSQPLLYCTHHPLIRPLTDDLVKLCNCVLRAAR